jgi:hypothetical protein
VKFKKDKEKLILKRKIEKCMIFNKEKKMKENEYIRKI